MSYFISQPLNLTMEQKNFVELGQVPDARRMHSASKFLGVKENQRKYPVTFNRLSDNQKQQH